MASLRRTTRPPARWIASRPSCALAPSSSTTTYRRSVLGSAGAIALPSAARAPSTATAPRAGRVVLMGGSSSSGWDGGAPMPSAARR